MNEKFTAEVEKKTLSNTQQSLYSLFFWSGANDAEKQKKLFLLVEELLGSGPHGKQEKKSILWKEMQKERKEKKVFQNCKKKN